MFKKWGLAHSRQDIYLANFDTSDNHFCLSADSVQVSKT